MSNITPAHILKGSQGSCYLHLYITGIQRGPRYFYTGNLSTQGISE